MVWWCGDKSMIEGTVFFKVFRAIALVLASSLFTGSNVVLAQTQDAAVWDFGGDRRPELDRLWPSEDRLARHGCAVQTKIIYKNYVVQHPEFRIFLNDEAVRREFRMSLSLASQRAVKYSSSYFTGCFVEVLDEHIRKFQRENADSRDPLVRPAHRLFEAIGWKRKPRNLYCGVLAENLDEEELETALAKQEITEYAFAENWSAVLSALWSDGDTVFFKYNPDVRYYLQLLLTKLTITKEQLKEINELIQQPVSNLSTKRRKFVEDAFERGDYQSVLNTTDPC